MLNASHGEHVPFPDGPDDQVWVIRMCGVICADGNGDLCFFGREGDGGVPIFTAGDPGEAMAALREAVLATPCRDVLSSDLLQLDTAWDAPP